MDQNNRLDAKICVGEKSSLIIITLKSVQFKPSSDVKESYSYQN